MADRPALHVIAYDIADDRRRRRIAALLEEQCVRVQERVFEVRLAARAARALMGRLEAAAGPGDSVRMYTIPDVALGRCAERGGPAIADGSRFWLL